MRREVFLTGLRTNAEYHLGNYIGALLPLLRLLEKLDSKQEIYLFAPDLHSFITPINFQKLQQQTLDNLKLFAAVGIPLDKPNVYLYRQSQISAHSELTWILSNFAGFGDLSRMIEFKEKSQRLGAEKVNAGLFFYPVLMAADILLYDARWVPTGEDQRQHLEFCRRLAKSFNAQFKEEVFLIPASFEKQQAMLGRQEAPRIRSLRDPSKKMSKSANDPAGTILLSDDSETIRQKIKAATTDTYASINYDWQKQPGIANLLTILASLSGQKQTLVNSKWQGKTNYLALKEAVVEILQQTLSDLQQRLKTIDDQSLLEHLQSCEAKLRPIAEAKLRRVQKLIGLRP